ncbi:hypothetical protein ACCX84_21845 [Pantoea trifolii]|uniref:hypothetical protein n=1 Tax=Pantoea trifolii TaxID=2968030 RepID=UPI003ED9DA8D
MKISDFIKGNDYFESLGFEEIQRRFSLSVIEDLPDNDSSRVIANLLNMYFLDYLYVSFVIIENFDDVEKMKIYETWICLLRERDDLEKMMRRLIRFKLFNKF